MRVTDILLEFAPTTPEEDEARLSSFPGQQPPIDDEPEVVDTTPDTVQQTTPAQPAPIIRISTYYCTNSCSTCFSTCFSTS